MTSPHDQPAWAVGRCGFFATARACEDRPGQARRATYTYRAGTAGAPQWSPGVVPEMSRDRMLFRINDSVYKVSNGPTVTAIVIPGRDSGYCLHQSAYMPFYIRRRSGRVSRFRCQHRTVWLDNDFARTEYAS